MRATPLFHRGHYEKLAAILGRRLAAEEFDNGERPEALVKLTGVLVTVFSDDNSEFDETKFLTAVDKHYKDTGMVLGLGLNTADKVQG